MQPEHFARIYNATPTSLLKTGDFAGKSHSSFGGDVRLFGKTREEFGQMGARDLSCPMGFLGNNDESSRRRVVYDSSGRDHDDWSEGDRNRGGHSNLIVNYNESTVNGTSRNGSVGPQSDGSDDYDEEEVYLEASDRKEELRNTPVAAEVLQALPVSHLEGRQDAFQAADRTRTQGGTPKFGMLLPTSTISFLNTFSPAAAAAAAAESEGGRILKEGSEQAPEFTMSYYNAASTPRQDTAANESAAQPTLRQFLSDPVSGELMEDAIIFPCGHSVGAAGFRRTQETNACPVCSKPTQPMSGAPNLALRAAVQAIKHEQESPKLATSRSTKRRREQEDLEGGKVKGVQFPYSVSDRVLIKGNKRTPERFVGREAIITTQCLNGWYLVRTTDNGESVRLQYRSLEKVGGQQQQQQQQQPQQQQQQEQEQEQEQDQLTL